MPIKKKNILSTKFAVKGSTEKITLKKEPKLTLVLNLNSEEQKVTGDTVEECMAKLKLPDAPATPALLTFSKGKDELFINLQISKVRRYINNETARLLLHGSWQQQLNTL